MVSKTYSISDIYYYDSCASDKTSKYTNNKCYWGETTPTVSFAQVDDHYEITQQGGFVLCGLPVPTSLDNYELTVEGYSASNQCGVGILQNIEQGFGLHQPNSTTSKKLILYTPSHGTGGVKNNTALSTFHVGEWHTYKLTKTGTTVTFEILYGDIILFTYTMNNIASNLATQTVPALSCYGGVTYYRNIKLKEL